MKKLIVSLILCLAISQLAPAARRSALDVFESTPGAHYYNFEDETEAPSERELIRPLSADMGALQTVAVVLWTITALLLFIFFLLCL